LGIAKANPQGCLIIGGSPFALALAKALHELDLDVVLMDTNRESVGKARLAGIVALSGSAVAANSIQRLPIGGVGRILALTPNDEVNALAGMQFQDLFGRAGVYQLRPSGAAAKQESSHRLRGRYLFQEGTSFDQLEDWIGQGARITATPLTQAFSFEHYLDHNQQGALPLFRFSSDGQLSIFSQETPPGGSAGDRIISLVMPKPEREEHEVEAAPANQA
jgi:hypothetical protein